jgi:16S rRNA (guanine966-N2)-methyltransferase
MRIIAGRHRGTNLAQPAGADTRPTGDRVRESLFNILEGGRFADMLAGGAVIDAFAGTGALGLEALSRGAEHASFIERDQAALSVLRANIDRLDREADSRVIAGDALSLASWRDRPASLMFADAPYGSGTGLAAAIHLADIGALAAGALVILETEKSEYPDPASMTAASLSPLDDRRYGRARLHFLQLTGR